MRGVKIGAGLSIFCLAAGLMLIALACFHGGVAWIAEAFSFVERLFRF